MKNLCKKKQVAIIISSILFYSSSAMAVCNASGNTLKTDDTLYYCSGAGYYEKVIVNTTGKGGIAPLGGFGINAKLSDNNILFADITYTSGSQFNQRQYNIGYRYTF
ncbi:autotransporter outer membrane beta-barrel domain-containing protein [Orbus wheelerorum]|uniref:autotransporter outer membrane beta-barrel domain-containing protein n=1 Tax=Orbus wheelerorum TaxID=3074111 RepID=UPI00370D1197